MEISAHSISKKYLKKFIIKDFSYTFNKNSIYGIAGPNGSGKSTLIQLLSCFMLPTKGNVSYKDAEGNSIKEDLVYKFLSVSAPYLGMDNDLTPNELFPHLKLFKNYGFSSTKELLASCDLQGNEDKQLSYFSSGMFQRLSISLALFSDSQVVFLDEPTSYLDQKGKDWFTESLRNNAKGRIVIIASNDPFDFKLINEEINIQTN